MEYRLWLELRKISGVDHSPRVALWRIQVGSILGPRPCPDWSGIGFPPQDVDPEHHYIRNFLRQSEQENPLPTTDPCMGLESLAELDYDMKWFWRERVITDDLAKAWIYR